MPVSHPLELDPQLGNLQTLTTHQEEGGQLW